MTHANVDPAEIAKFSALASRWWDPQSEFRPLHQINPLRLDYIERKAGLAERKVVDIGCGGGLLSEGMAQRGAQVTAIDLGEAALAVARLHQLESGVAVDYRHTSAEALAAESPGEFDVVTCLEMLEHVPDPAAVVTAAAALAKPGGHLFFSTINRNPKSFLFAIVGAEYVLSLLPKGTHACEKFIRPAELASWLRGADLQLQDTIGLVYNPITKHYRLAENTDVNYMVHVRKPLAA